MATDRKTGDAKVDELVELYGYHRTAWAPIRNEGGIDMRYVSGDPWDEADKELRGDDRPSVAPEEMSQYRNQVVNALMSNPRGAKFSPSGNGASERGAEFYQNKWREIEYRSHAPQQYVTVADHVLQRSYGFLRLKTAYASPRSENQELWLEAFADPDMVVPDTDCQALDGRGSVFTAAFEWMDQGEFKRKHRGARIHNFTDFAETKKDWIQGSRVLRAEIWRLETTPKQLLLVQPRAAVTAPPPGSMLGLQGQAAAPRPMQVFEEELEDLKKKYPAGIDLLRRLRMVDYPKVKQYFTNGLEILSEHDWVGVDIPIMPCYGKVLYVPTGGRSEKVILSMTRFGRDPWKSYCYACSQELEVLGMVPKSPLLAVEGQFANREDEVEAVAYSPKAFLYYKARTADTGDAILGPPIPLDYPVGQHLQALEIVKEGFRRAIQAAMGSNFLPTNAQRINDKSGEALKKIDDVATQGTYHFVYAYDSMIRRAAQVGETLLDKIFAYAGETAIRSADDKSSIVEINTTHKDAYSTDGDYGVTVSTGPSSDSVREAGEDFVNTMSGNIEKWIPIVGPKVCAAMLAIMIRMRSAQLGPLAEQLADMIEPPEFKAEDGKPPDPRLLAAQGHIQQLEAELQKLGMVIQTDQVKGETQYKIAALKVGATSEDKAADREVKLAVAELTAKTDRLALMLEESRLVGARHADAVERLHEHLRASRENTHQRVHEAIQNEKDRAHEAGLAAAKAASGSAEADAGRAHASFEAAAERAAASSEAAGV